MKSLLPFITLSVAWCIPAVGQIKPLVRTVTIPTTLTFDVNRSFALPTACDEQGRSYVKFMGQDGNMMESVYRVSDRGQIEAQFDITGTLGNTFAVRPNAGIAAAHIEGKAKVIDNFAPDGTRESQVRLETPPAPFFPMQSAVFPSGEIFVARQTYRSAREASAAVYDAEGHLLKQIPLDRDEVSRANVAENNNEAGITSRSVAIAGDDGYVYLMRATSPPVVYAISSTGEIVRNFVVKGPAGTAVPAFGFRAAKGKLLVEFYRECQDPAEISSCRGRLYTVVDAKTGVRMADYEPAQGVAGPIAGYVPDPDRLYMFSIPPANHHLEIVVTVPR
jgi:hypothetical protein